MSKKHFTLPYEGGLIEKNLPKGTEVGASHFVSMRPSYRALIDSLDELGAVDLKAVLAKQTLDESKMNWKM